MPKTVLGSTTSTDVPKTITDSVEALSNAQRNLTRELINTPMSCASRVNGRRTLSNAETSTLTLVTQKEWRKSSSTNQPLKFVPTQRKRLKPKLISLSKIPSPKQSPKQCNLQLATL